MKNAFTATSTLALLAVGTTTPALANDDPWAVLSAIEIDEIVSEGSYRVVKTYPVEIENGVERFQITGYAMPLTPEPGTATTQVMLVSDMGDCPFCGSPEHGGQLQVELAEPVVIEDGARISVVGALELVDDPETWQAAIMRGATVTGS